MCEICKTDGWCEHQWKRRSPLSLPPKKVLAAYERYGTATKVARRFKASPHTVTRVLEREGIETLNRGQPRKRDERFVSFLVSIVVCAYQERG